MTKVRHARSRALRARRVACRSAVSRRVNAAPARCERPLEVYSFRRCRSIDWWLVPVGFALMGVIVAAVCAWLIFA